MPSISVVIPAYNAEAFIVRTLDSVERQKLQPNEVVVVDDGSQDSTALLVSDFSASSTLKIRLVKQTNKGSASARNLGIEISTGELIAFLDADDVIYPDFLAAASTALAAQPHWLACFSDRNILDQNGQFISRDLDHPGFKSLPKKRMASGLVELLKDGLFEAMLDGSLIPMTIVCRRQDVEAIGGFDSTVSYHEDRLFMLRLIKRGVMGYVDIPLGTWERHGKNKSGDSSILSQHASSELILRKVLSSDTELELSPKEIEAAKRSQRRLAKSWVYAASRSGAVGAVTLIQSMFRQRRIGYICALKAVGRFLYWRGVRGRKAYMHAVTSRLPTTLQ
jgi:glycosyltransferase involved in cell wall biosynthesis